MAYFVKCIIPGIFEKISVKVVRVAKKARNPNPGGRKGHLIGVAPLKGDEAAALRISPSDVKKIQAATLGKKGKKK